MDFSLTVLGVSSGLPTSKRFSTAHVLNVHGHLFLIDCGEGTQVQLRRLRVKFSKINHIFISHLHGDHFFGIFGFLSSLNLLHRQNDVHLYAPAKLEKMLTSELSPLDVKQLNYKLIFHDHKPGVNVVLDNKKLKVTSFPLKHRIETWGFRFDEKPKPPNIKKEKISEFNLSIEEIVKIKNGADLRTENGEIIENKEFLIPSKKPRSYAFCSDTVYTESIIPQIKGVDLLYHETTFLHEDKKQAELTKHTTAKEAGILARKAKVKQLLIGHYSARYKTTKDLHKEAKQEFDNTLAAYDGMQIEINS